MIEIASVKTLVDIIKQVIDRTTGSQESSLEQFDKSLGALFNELEVVAQSYFSLFTELSDAIKASPDRKAFTKSIDIALSQRRKIILNRSKVYGSIRAYEKILIDKGINTRPVSTTGNYMLMFLSNVDAFFYESFAQGTSHFTLVLDTLESIQDNLSEYSSA